MGVGEFARPPFDKAVEFVRRERKLRARLLYPDHRYAMKERLRELAGAVGLPGGEAVVPPDLAKRRRAIEPLAAMAL